MFIHEVLQTYAFRHTPEGQANHMPAITEVPAMPHARPNPRPAVLARNLHHRPRPDGHWFTNDDPNAVAAEIACLTQHQTGRLAFACCALRSKWVALKMHSRDLPECQSLEPPPLTPVSV